MNGVRTVGCPPLALVLDDEIAVGAMICKQLSLIGIEALQFSEPQKFLEVVRVTPPALVVLDLALGQSDAVEVIRELEVLGFAGRVLLVSGRGERALGEIERIGRLHGLHILQSLEKPFRASHLRNRLQDQSRPAVHCGPKLDPPARVKLTVDLSEALREDWLEVWYQPKINLKSLTVCGAEALIRARHPEFGVISPINLLPAAGDHLYEPLSLFVLGRTMQDWASFEQRGFPLELAINIPVSVLSSPAFVDAVRQSIPSIVTFPGLIIEITEDEIIKDHMGVYEIISQLQLHKTSISIDDFGTGHSSLSRVKDLPFREIKLDRSFVTNCASDPLKRGLCQTVVDIAHRFDASACAEGVETTDDLQCLVDLGFDTAQGFLFSGPMPKNELSDALLSRQFESLSATTFQRCEDLPLAASGGSHAR